MELRSLKDLFVRELKDIYGAEDQVLESLPKIAEFAVNSKLKDAFYQHMKETELQIKRLEEIFSHLGIRPEVIACKGMAGIIAEVDEVLDHPAFTEVMDAAIIACAQRVEHYEMAAYGSARTYARLLGDSRSAELLEQTLEEEKRADRLLTELAAGMINERAARL